MKKFILIFTSIVAVLFFSSCEGETTRQWIITNQSSSTITVEDHSLMNDETSTTSIPVGEQKVIEWTSQRGGSSKEVFPSEVFYSITIENAAGEISTKDCLANGIWKSEIVRRKKVPSIYEHKYYVMIKDEDF